MSFYDDASLVVIPSAQKTSKLYAVKPTDGSGDLAFTRTGDTATRVNSAGLIERVRTNLVLQSQAFDNAAYAKISGGTATTPIVTANFATSPDGLQNAERIQFARTGTTSSDFSLINQGSLTLSATGTASIYLKSNTSSNQNILIYWNGGQGQVFTVTPEWQRFTLNNIITAGDTIVIGTRGGSGSYFNGGDLTLDVLFYGLQVETSDFGPTSYIPTTTAAVSVGPVANVPRLDYLGSTCPRLILEPQRTNLITFSEQLNNAAYTAVSCTVSANAATSPDGYTNADSISTTAANSFFGAASAVTISADASTYTQSVFVKWVSGSEIVKLRVALTSGTSVAKETIANVRTGVITYTDSTAQIVSYGNGWYRISQQVTNNSTNTNFNYQFYPTNDGTNTNVIRLWGCMAEIGAYATSYIPTLAASATRGADACSKTGISSLIGQTEGVAFIDFVWNGLTGVGSYPRIIELATDANNIIQLYSIAGTTSWGWDIFNGGVVQFTGSSTMALGRNKIAIGYKLNDMVVYKNGTLLASDTSCTVPATSALGVTGIFNGVGGAQLAASVNQTLLFKTRLTNAELAELTTL